MNVLVINPEGATLSVMVSDISGNTAPSLTPYPGGGQMGGPETINATTSFYLANPGEVLVSMLTMSGAEVATSDGTPLRIMVSGTVNINPFMANEEQATLNSRPGGWPGDMRPFPGHWYGPRTSASLFNIASDIYRQIALAPITVVDGVAKVAFRGHSTGTSDPVTVAIYNSDRNNWPSTLVWSSVLPNGYTAYEVVEVDGPDAIGSLLPDGLYWATVVQFDDASGVGVCGYCDYGSGYAPVGNAPFPSFGASASDALNNTLIGSAGQTVIHATSIGGGTIATITELPTTITPGVDNMGSYYAPIMLVKSAWGG